MPAANRSLIWLLWAVAAWAAPFATADDPKARVPVPDAPDALDAGVHANWRNVPLREWAERIARVAGRPVVVDHAIDPDTPITLNCDGEPLREILDRAAAAAGGGVDVLKSSIRIVPAPRTGLAVRAERARDSEVSRLPPAGRSVIEAPAPWIWPAGSRPRDLVTALAGSAGLTVTGLDAVPHDHLPAGSLPPLTLAERFDLLLGHYGLRVEWTAAPAEAGGRPGGRVVKLEFRLPPPTVAARATNAAPVPPSRRPSGGRPVTAERRFTLRLQAPLEEALRAITAQLGLELEIDRPALAARGIMTGEIVTAQVTDASRDELLDAVVRPVGLVWRIEGDRLLVGPRPHPDGTPSER